jgi:chromate reductase, NAD(P)H dehydrogenase (quinone)
MSRKYNVAVLVGSLRQGSFNRMLANAAAKLAPPTLALGIVEIGALPLYNQDLDGANAPGAWISFRQALKSADAFLFVTPEYNRSVPGCLKNAIDVGSRPYGQSSFGAGKPGAVISLSPGAVGAFGANQHLRQSLVFLDVAAMQQPEAYIGGAAKLFDDAGNLANDGTKEFLQKFMQSFAGWVGKLVPA